MMVLGIDPGSRRNGWALLDFSIRTAPIWFDGGTFADAGEFFGELLGLGHVVALVVVERAVALHNPAANVQAMGTAWAGGVAYGVALGLGLNVRAIGVTQWRRAFVGRFERGAKVDMQIDAVLRRTVRGLPPRTNVHMRDAAGVACVGARAYRPVGLPPHRRLLVRPSENQGNPRKPIGNYRPCSELESTIGGECVSTPTLDLKTRPSPDSQKPTHVLPIGQRSHDRS